MATVSLIHAITVTGSEHKHTVVLLTPQPVSAIYCTTQCHECNLYKSVSRVLYFEFPICVSLKNSSLKTEKCSHHPPPPPWSFIVYNTFLKLHSQRASQHSPKKDWWRLIFVLNCKNKAKQNKKLPCLSICMKISRQWLHLYFLVNWFL